MGRDAAGQLTAAQRATMAESLGRNKLG